MKNCLKFGLIIFTVLFATNLFAELKIGIFDMQKIMINSQEGKDIKKLLEQKRNFYSQEIKKREEKLKKMRQELEKKAMLMSPEAKKKIQTEYAMKLNDLKFYASNSENELKSLYQEKTQKLIQDILKIARDYGKKNNFTFIIEKQEGGIVYMSKAVDITDKILKKFNEYYEKNKNK